VAETIENNLRKVIIDEQPTNPKYYERMSVLLDELIEERKQQVRDYAAYLRKIVELTGLIAQPHRSSRYPKTLNTGAKRALYDNLNQNEELALALDLEIRNTKKDGWRGHKIKRNEVRNAIKKHVLGDDVDRILEIVKSQSEY
jgi:type I restriction enzyme, R subunit